MITIATLCGFRKLSKRDILPDELLRHKKKNIGYGKIDGKPLFKMVFIATFFTSIGTVATQGLTVLPWRITCC
ncbi:MAG: hypothetical protein V2B20_19470 [Pseudomonadota bacterium]